MEAEKNRNDFREDENMEVIEEEFTKKPNGRIVKGQKKKNRKDCGCFGGSINQGRVRKRF